MIWFVLAAWIFFGGAEYMGLLLAMVSGFFLMAMGIPFALWRVWGRHRPGAPREERNSFAEWASGQFETATGQRNAMGILFHFVALGSRQL